MNNKKAKNLGIKDVMEVLGPKKPKEINTNEQFGEVLKDQREFFGLSIDDLADELHCSPDKIKLFEAGEKLPSSKMFISYIYRLLLEINHMCFYIHETRARDRKRVLISRFRKRHAEKCNKGNNKLL